MQLLSPSSRLSLFDSSPSPLVQHQDLRAKERPTLFPFFLSSLSPRAPPSSFSLTPAQLLGLDNASRESGSKRELVNETQEPGASQGKGGERIASFAKEVHHLLHERRHHRRHHHRRHHHRRRQTVRRASKDCMPQQPLQTTDVTC